MHRFGTQYRCVFVFLYLHLSEDQHEFLTKGVRLFLGSKEILVVPYYVFRLFFRVKTWFKVRVRNKFRLRVRLGI